MNVDVRRVDSAATWPLRQEVLRPHEHADHLPDSETFAAFADGVLISTASVRREPPPWSPDDTSAWRLRGMATEQAWRGRGVGARVLSAVVDHVRHHGGGLLWCNARTPALRFYERAGFATRGEPWVDPEIGPHVAMELKVAEAP